MKHITLIITGSIAAPKALILLKKLQTQFKVAVICTKSAGYFLKNKDFPHYSEMFEKELYEKADLINHTDLALNTDLVVVYPATMSFISKANLAIADSLALATFLAAKAPKILFPAMNHFMYHNQGLQNNLAALAKLDDVTIIAPDRGMLACNIKGDGRLKEPNIAFDLIKKNFAKRIDLSKKTVLINYGRTRTYLDPIRYITNNSSGKMGQALVKAFAVTNAKIIAVVGDSDCELPVYPNVTIVSANNNEHMLVAMEKYFSAADVVLCVAALNDYQSATYINKKITKTEHSNLAITLIPNIDVLAALGKKKTKQILIGFAAQDGNDKAIGLQKMKNKNCDGICINNIKVMTKEVTNIDFYFNNKMHNIKGTKDEVATKIVTLLSKNI